MPAPDQPVGGEDGREVLGAGVPPRRGRGEASWRRGWQLLQEQAQQRGWGGGNACALAGLGRLEGERDEAGGLSGVLAFYSDGGEREAFRGGQTAAS